MRSTLQNSSATVGKFAEPICRNVDCLSTMPRLNERRGDLGPRVVGQVKLLDDGDVRVPVPTVDGKHAAAEGHQTDTPPSKERRNRQRRLLKRHEVDDGRPLIAGRAARVDAENQNLSVGIRQQTTASIIDSVDQRYRRAPRCRREIVNLKSVTRRTSESCKSVVELHHALALPKVVHWEDSR